MLSAYSLLLINAGPFNLFIFVHTTVPGVSVFGALKLINSIDSAVQLS